MRNTWMLLFLVAVVALIPFMVSRNNHTATIVGSFPEELTGVNYQWVYLKGGEGLLDSCMVQEHRFELQAEIGQYELDAIVEIPCCSLSQTITLRPQDEIHIRVSLDEYYRQRVESSLNETLARLDQRGLSIPDSIWTQMRDSLLKAFIEMQQKE